MERFVGRKTEQEWVCLDGLNKTFRPFTLTCLYWIDFVVCVDFRYFLVWDPLEVNKWD